MLGGGREYSSLPQGLSPLKTNLANGRSVELARVSGSDSGDWIRSQLQGGNITRFLACIWGIWKWQNTMLFEETPWTVHKAWRKICQEHDELDG